MDKEIKNAQAISCPKDEIGQIRKRQGLVLSFFNVVYLHKGNREEERLKINVYLTNFDYEKIEMEEHGRLRSKSHHLGFFSQFENYTYDKIQKIFTTIGHSIKMRDYEVQILIDERI